MIDIRPVADGRELRQVFDVLGAQLPIPIDSGDRRFDQLRERFPADRPLMAVAIAERQLTGGALAFRNDDGWTTLRSLAVVDGFRSRGIGRRLVAGVEDEARRLGVRGVALGTGEEVAGFWFRLGYDPRLLLQWVYDADVHESETEAVLSGPLAGLPHWRSTFDAVPQLFVEILEPSLDLLDDVRHRVSGCHAGFMFQKTLVPGRHLLLTGLTSSARSRSPTRPHPPRSRG